MKVSKKWLQELIELKVPMEELEQLLPLRTISTKEVTDQFIELDMKGYNRADLLSMRGVGREVAAITDSQIKFTDTADFIWQDQSLSKLTVTVDSKLCSVYSLAKIEGLTVGPSPKDWIDKLEASGMRSVNNLTDITNLIMLEYGQPLHAFDAAKVSHQQIIVRTAREGESLKTLDDKTRQLESTDLVITDPDQILGLAGVMGGKDSEISDQTTTVLLEAAIFDSISIRQTANRLGLNSEAAKRFIHGLTTQQLCQAMNAAIKLYQQLGGKLTGIHLPQIKDQAPIEIPLTVEQTNKLIGINLSDQKISQSLAKLQIKQLADNLFSPPYWRLDLKISEDLIEEVARMYGYENIPAQALPNTTPQVADQSLFELVKKLRHNLVNIGLTEVQTYSFASTAVLDSLDFDDAKKQNLVKVANPISAETEYLRENIWPNLVEVVAKNYRQGLLDIAIFEIGRVFYPPENQNQPPKEGYCLSLALINGSDHPLQELIAILEKLDLDIKISGPSDKEMPQFHPIRHRALIFDNKPIGGIAEVHPRVVNRLGIDKRVAVFEFNLKALL